MNIATSHIQQYPSVDVITAIGLQFSFVEQRQFLVAVTFPVGFMVFQSFKLLFVYRGEQTALAVITVDVKFFNQAANDIAAFKNHAAQRIGGLFVVTFLDDIDIA